MAENKIKSIANCKPSEFLKQTNAIRHYVEKWLKLIKFSDIRKHLPTVPDGATDEEVNELIREQNHKNFSDMLDAALDQYPKKPLVCWHSAVFCLPRTRTTTRLTCISR